MLDNLVRIPDGMSRASIDFDPAYRTRRVRKLIAKIALLVLALLAAAYLSDIRADQPKPMLGKPKVTNNYDGNPEGNSTRASHLISGFMCNTADQLDRFFDLTVVAGAPEPVSVRQVNDEAHRAACGSIKPAKFLMKTVELRRTEIHDGTAYYFYSGTVLGFLDPVRGFGVFRRPMQQHFMLLEPLDEFDRVAAA